MKTLLCVLSILVFTSVYGQKELTGVRPVTDGDSPIIPISHEPFADSDGANVEWLFFEVPALMEEAIAVTPDGIVLGHDGENTWYRWSPGGAVEQLSHFPLVSIFPLETRAVMNRRGDVACWFHRYVYTSNGEGVDTYSESIIEYWPIDESGPISISVPRFTYTELFDCFLPQEEDLQESTLYGLDDLGTLWMRQASGVESVGCSLGLAEEFIGRSLVGGGTRRTELFEMNSVGRSFISPSVNATGFYFGSYLLDDTSTRYHVLNDEIVGTDPPSGSPTGVEVVWLNSWGVALTTGDLRFPDGSVEPLPGDEDSDFEWIDELGRVRGYYRTFSPSVRHDAVWEQIRDEDGLFLGYERRDYEPFELPSGWTSNHEIAPGEILPQLGIANNGSGDVPFLLLPVKVDLDVDSDNDGVLDRSISEDELEEPSVGSENPGKVLIVNSGDADDDGVPDFADGLNLFLDDGTRSTEDAGVAESGKFIPIAVELPTIPAVAVRFEYPASIPSSVSRSLNADGSYRYEAGSGSLRLWTKNGDELRRVESVGIDAVSGDFIEPGVFYSRDQLGFEEGQTTKIFYLESVQASENLAEQEIILGLSVFPETGEIEEPEVFDNLAFTSVLIRMVTDYDRNGIIDSFDYDKLEAGTPFYFWVNDDADTVDSEVEGDDIPGQIGNNSTLSFAPGANQVDGTRDLIDFFPVYFDIQNLLDLLARDDIEINLYGAEVNYVEVQFANPNGFGLGPNTVGTFHRFPDRARWFEGVETKGVYQTIISNGQTLSSDFNLQAKNGNGTIIVEGRSESNIGSLKARVSYRGNVLHDLVLPIRLSKVEDMFMHMSFVNLLGVESQEDEVGVRLNTPGLDDSETNGKNIVFIHGFNVSQQNARGWNAEFYKRLYQSGSRAKFTGITWHGDTNPNYHKAVINAFETGDRLGGLLSFLEGEVNIAAHSLGNLVVSHAISKGTFDPDRYFMLNAAVPIESYDEGQTANSDNADMKNNMRHISWEDYEERLWASSWHSLFPGDSREKFTWKGLFGDLGGRAFNFYSTGDEIVRNAPVAPLTSIGNLTNILTNGGTLAWVAQAKLKGRNALERVAIPEIVDLDVAPELGVFELLLPDQHGGWGHNSFHWMTSFPELLRVPTPEEASTITPELLRVEPFFRKFEPTTDRFENYNGDALMAPLGDVEAIIQASIKETQYKVLAEAIPEISFAVAANRVLDFDNFGDRNFSVNELFQNSWPDERLSSGDGNDWLHSDLKEVAYPYVYKYYDKLVEIGGLDEE